MLRPSKIAPLITTCVGLWMCLLGLVGLGLIVTLIGGTWLFDGD
jgi:hypothetical protein